MRTLRTYLDRATKTLLLFGLLFGAGATRATAQDPDPGEAAAQAAQQAAIEATQLAQQQMQQMQDENSARLSAQFQHEMQDSANAVQQNSTPVCCVPTALPTFSVKPGTYAKALEVKIRDNTRGAVIYYTTDGWTPTTASARYIGPVEIDATTQLQAIAVGPSPLFARSLVAKAQYTVTVAGMAPVTPLATAAGLSQGLQARSLLLNDAMDEKSSGNRMLPQGTPVHLEFVTSVNSKTADVGDKIELKLAEDVKEGDAVLVAKGAKAEATVTEADKTGPGGAPGNIVFEVRSMNLGGKIIPLNGSATLEGEPKPPNAAVLIPVVGFFTVFRHGKDAEIKAGTLVTAYVATDTALTSK